ncbi:retropepsin-like aspartic protease [Akkermansia sp.]|uniref:retropepsin-like aspartic protease n=1 Tax=Akkermansia sp. TaxID=1872421 RepID=UPI0025BA7DFD|nr:retropepsin-like aspartic protease [Akkermansia sp.]MCC8147553.1 retropepsin-like domain-containing protein [Akkermansia sp.]
MTRLGKFIPFFFILLSFFSSAQEANVPSASIPFELGTASRIYVKGSVNGSRPLRFLFDTGATAMVISTNSLKGISMEFNETVVNHGATGSGEVHKSTENKFSIGGQSMEHVPFIAIPYSPDQWDGVLGLWFIQQQVTEVNYTDRKIYLYPHGSYTPPPHAIRLKIEYVMGIPVVPGQVTVNGKTHQLRLSVDTGSDRVLDLNTPFVKKHHLLGSQTPFSISRISSSDPNTGVLENVLFDSIQLGDCKLPLIPGAFSTVTGGTQSSAEMDGVMGNNLLKRFNMVYNAKEGYIYLIPNNLLYTPFYDCLLKPKPEANLSSGK